MHAFFELGNVQSWTDAAIRIALVWFGFKAWDRPQEDSMNWDVFEGKWKQSMGKVTVKWGKLTDDDVTAVNGKREQLVGKIQERYGLAKDTAEKQVDEFIQSFSPDDAAKAAKAS